MMEKANMREWVADIAEELDRTIALSTVLFDRLADTIGEAEPWAPVTANLINAHLLMIKSKMIQALKEEQEA